ncbi:MAG TPA: type VI secretion system-associated FHA domain protein TagH, partial [Roseiarcus sp.]|nr:type VI secretion system-associated FHA domain protein TagH [Roseiarcus sp.]
RLSIENLDRLPDGGPLRVQVQGRGLDIGRDQHLDWTLPDPSRLVSGKHCEIRFRDGGYWLHDVSTNGTFVNGAQFRLSGPHLLRNGDRLTIGQYIIAVEVEGQADFAASVPGGTGQFDQATGADPWSGDGAAAPDDRRAYMPPPVRPKTPDFLDFASGIPAAPVDDFAAPPAVAPEDDWLRGRPTPLPVMEPVAPAAPTPRRPAPRPELAEERPEIAEANPLPPPVVAKSPPAVGPPALPPLAASQLPPGQTPAKDAELLMRIARAAGIAERAFEGRDPAAIADDIGVVLRLLAHNLAQMLSSRSETKGVMRSANRTMIRALENNPLKFTASPEEALSIMFGPPTRNYLNAQTAVERSFADLKAHQIQTFGAMQAALEALFEDLAPEKIDRSVEAERGLGGLVGSRKAKLWDVYAERWRAKTKRSDGRLSDAFMTLFAESYDRLQKKEP